MPPGADFNRFGAKPMCQFQLFLSLWDGAQVDECIFAFPILHTFDDVLRIDENSEVAFNRAFSAGFRFQQLRRPLRAAVGDAVNVGGRPADIEDQAIAQGFGEHFAAEQYRPGGGKNGMRR